MALLGITGAIVGLGIIASTIVASIMAFQAIAVKANVIIGLSLSGWTAFLCIATAAVIIASLFHGVATLWLGVQKQALPHWWMNLHWSWRILLFPVMVFIILWWTVIPAGGGWQLKKGGLFFLGLFLIVFSIVTLTLGWEERPMEDVLIALSLLLPAVGGLILVFTSFRYYREGILIMIGRWQRERI